MNPPDYTSLPTRFWDKVEINEETGCWVWNAWLSGKGNYGYFKYQGKNQRAHRLAVVDYYGEIPAGMFALHHCDNPPCVRHDHLYIGDNFDNARDKSERGRELVGSARPDAKLTESQVLSIRDLHASGKATINGLGRQFGVNAGTVSLVVHRKAWKHV